MHVLAAVASLALADPPRPHPTDLDRYRVVLWRVYSGREQTLLVGPDIPDTLTRCDGWVSDGFLGLTAGLYRCYRKDGRPVMERVARPAPTWLPGPAWVGPLNCVGPT